jgi:hypothetical protein
MKKTPIVKNDALSIILSKRSPTMDNDKRISVICQCLNVLQISRYRSPFLDHRSHKLHTGMAIELHVLAQLLQLKSYDLITEQLKARGELQKWIGIDSISSSQLSRKTKSLCILSLQSLFYGLIEQIRRKTACHAGSFPSTGRLHLVDATDIQLPKLLGSWARCGSRKTGVRLHVRLVVADSMTVFPNKIIASTSNVREAKVALELVAEDDVTYVMDRGYESSAYAVQWVKADKKFVVRVKARTQFHPVPQVKRKLAEGSRVVSDIDVVTNKSTTPVRLVEFTDEKGRSYRVVTSRWDIPAEEIAQIYKSRWLIELFFKWIKQHLNVVNLYSFDPTAVWNQLFLSLISFAVSLLVKLELQTTRSQFDVLKLIRTYV